MSCSAMLRAPGLHGVDFPNTVPFAPGCNLSSTEDEGLSWGHLFGVHVREVFWAGLRPQVPFADPAE